MHRLATGMAVLAALLGGCGGDSGKDGSGSSSSAAAQTPDVRSAAKEDAGKANPDSTTSNKRSSKSKADGRTEPPAAADSGPQDVEDALDDAPADDTRKLIESAARTTLEFFGLTFAGAEVSNRGKSVHVLVGRKTACNAVARDEPAMAMQIRRGVPSVKTVSFEVAGTGKKLGYYVLGCEREEIPSGPGQVVFEKTAVGGPVLTRSFTITGKRWAIEYENVGNSLLVIVEGTGKSREKYQPPAGAQKREVGRKEYKGGGSYRLRIHGGGLWTVRVKDIR